MEGGEGRGGRGGLDLRGGRRRVQGKTGGLGQSRRRGGEGDEKRRRRRRSRWELLSVRKGSLRFWGICRKKECEKNTVGKSMDKNQPLETTRAPKNYKIHFFELELLEQQ